MLMRPPSTQALMAFEALVRHKALSAAASELHINPSTLSYQIKVLETHFGQRLFLRKRDGFELTEYGAEIIPVVRGLLDSLTELEQFTGMRRRIRIACPISFKVCWLLPRLRDFAHANPNIDICLISERRNDVVKLGEADIVIQYHEALYGDVDELYLFSEGLCVGASPSFLADYPLADPTDLVSVPLVLAPHTPWVPWFRSIGLHTIAEPQRGLVIDSAIGVVEAAVQGIGAALIRDKIGEAAFKSGRLIKLFDDRPKSYSYYAVCAHAARQRPEIVNFLDWLKQQVSADGN